MQVTKLPYLQAILSTTITHILTTMLKSIPTEATHHPNYFLPSDRGNSDFWVRIRS